MSKLPWKPKPIQAGGWDVVTYFEYEQLYRIAEDLEKERDALFIEYISRRDWIAKMNTILGHDNSDGFHSSPDPFEIAQQLVELAEIGRNGIKIHP